MAIKDKPMVIDSDDDVQIVLEALEGSNALSFLMIEYGKLINKGYARPFTLWNSKHKVCWARQKSTDKVMCALLFGINQETASLWMLFSVTAEEFQRQGVFQATQSYLEKYAKSEGCVEIVGHIHMDNVASLNGCSKFGLVPESYRVVKKL